MFYVYINIHKELDVIHKNDGISACIQFGLKCIEHVFKIHLQLAASNVLKTKEIVLGPIDLVL